MLATVPNIEVLHDRIRPGTRSSNIDHIVVGPGAVYVIDAKNLTGNIEIRDVGGLFRTDLRLYVGGRNRTTLTEGVNLQVAAVRELLQDKWPDVPVKGALCFVEAARTRDKPRSVAGVHIVSSKSLAAYVTSPGDRPIAIAEIATALRSVLKRAAK